MSEDIRDLAAKAEEKAEELAQENNRKRWGREFIDGKMLKLGELIEAEIPEPPRLIDNVLPGASVGIVAGYHKVGKTILMIQMAVSVASGRPFLLWETERTPVLYLGYEVHPYYLKQRVKRAVEWASATGQLATGDEVDRIRFERKAILDNISLMKPRFGVGSESELKKLAQMVGDLGAGLVIVDPLRVAFIGDRNKDDAVDRLMTNLLEHVVVPTGAAVVLGHHMRKPQQGETASATSWKIKGSSSFVDAADAIIMLERDSKKDQGNSGLERKLAIVSRHYEGYDGVNLKLQPASMRFITDQERETPDEVLLEAAFRDRGEMDMGEIAEVLGIQRRSAQKRWESGRLPSPIRQRREARGTVAATYIWEANRTLPDPY